MDHTRIGTYILAPRETRDTNTLFMVWSIAVEVRKVTDSCGSSGVPVCVDVQGRWGEWSDAQERYVLKPQNPGSTWITCQDLQNSILDWGVPPRFT